MRHMGAVCLVRKTELICGHKSASQISLSSMGEGGFFITVLSAVSPGPRRCGTSSGRSRWSDKPEWRRTMQCKSILPVIIAVIHYKSFSYGKSAIQIIFLMLGKFVVHFYEYDTLFAMHTQVTMSIIVAIWKSNLAILVCTTRAISKSTEVEAAPSCAASRAIR